MKTPKGILQDVVDEMNREYMRLLKTVQASDSTESKQENAEQRLEINDRINEFNNAISKIS